MPKKCECGNIATLRDGDFFLCAKHYRILMRKRKKDNANAIRKH